ncbi:MAG: MarR family winged helix-turn-helix transcriptional regulator [Planctomycetota bacterium]|nr:MarR family winged helix-turn-helix transcriptional regulator [Planctomycetota bacterium]
MSSDQPATIDPSLAGLPCFNLYLGWRRIQAFYKPYFEGPVNPPRMYLLELLRPHPKDGLIVGELATAMDLDAGTVSGMLSRMQAEGWVERRRCPEERRRVQVVLTAAGRELCTRNEAHLRRADESLHRHLGPADLAALQRINDQLAELLAKP